MAEPYSLEDTEDGLIFVTTAGITYAVLFREQQAVLFPALLHLRHRIFTFAFFPLDTPAEKPRPDERIMPTIVKAIRYKFADELNVVLFVVEDGDARQDARWRMFETLYAATRDTEIELLRGALTKGDTSVGSGVLVHKANPFRNAVAGQFFALLARFSKE